MTSPNSRGPILNPGPALPPRTWSKPMEFDPAAAARVAAPQLTRQYTRQQKLRDELGFDEDTIADPEEDEEEDDFPSRRPPANFYSQRDRRSSVTEDLESAMKSLRTATEGRRTAESKVRELSDRIDELQRLSAQSKSILVNKFKEQMKALMVQIEEQKSTISEQDEEGGQMKAAISKYQSGDPSQKISADEAAKKLLALKDQKRMEREMGEVKFKLQQANADVMGKDNELKQSLAELNAANEKMSKLKDEYEKQIQQMQKQMAQTATIAHSANGSTEGGNHVDNSIAAHTALSSISEDSAINSSVLSTSTLSSSTSSSSISSSPSSSPSSSSSSSSSAAVKASSELVRSLESTLDSVRSDLSKAEKDLSQFRHKFSRLTGDEVNVLEMSDNDLLTFFTKRYEKEKVVEVKVAAAPEVADDSSNPKVIALTDSLQQTKSALITAQQEANIASATIMDLEKERNDLREQIKGLEEGLHKKDIESNLVKEKAKEKLQTASDSIKKLKTEYASLRAQYSVAKAGNTTYRDNAARRKVLLASIQAKNNENKNDIADLREELSNGISNLFKGMDSVILSTVSGLIAKKRGEYDALLTLYKKELLLRKQLFNQIQELKGNIRVYCRVRPLSQREIDDSKNAIDFVEDEEKNKLTIENPEKRSLNTFEFEKIFRPESTQDEVFSEVCDLVTSVMDGYNVCIFAYGQTGSGKTYTMEGPREDPGVNIRALSRLFEIEKERESDMVYDIKISLLEIYNEKIQDLLNPQGKQVLKAVAGQYGMEVPELTMVKVSNRDDVVDTLNVGRKNRKVVATAMNDASSRSHLILSIYVMGRNKVSKKEQMGKLHLIDLAGSERISRSGVTGDALKEAQNINSSLSALGNVIAARGAKAAHVPYRDSQLTYLLQDSLEKNSKTLMFVQVSPNGSDSGESVCSLRFAERVRKVELGKASVNRRNSVDVTSH